MLNLPTSKKLACLIFLLFGLMILMGSSSMVQCAEPGELRVERLETVISDGQPSYMYIELSYPYDWGEDASVSFTVNGQPALCENGGGGSGSGLLYSGYLLYVGEPGHKTIQATLKSKTNTAQVQVETDFNSSGDIVALDCYDGEAVFKDNGLRFWSCFANKFSLKVNEETISYQVEPLLKTQGIALITVAPCLKPGKNLITYEGVDFNGKAFKRQLTLYMFENNQVKLGTRFQFPYGYPGSKSGPFFALDTTGDSIAMIGRGREASFPTLMNSLWLFSKTVYTQTMETVKEGAFTIKIMKKNNFLDSEYLLDKETTLNVIK